MVGSGVATGTPASLVRCSLAELSRPAELPHSFPYKVFALQEIHNKPVHPVRTCLLTNV